MNNANSVRKHPSVVGNTKPGELNDRRRAIEASAEWVRQNGRPVRHGRPPLPQPRRSAGLAFTAAVLLALDYAVKAEQEMNARTARGPGSLNSRADAASKGRGDVAKADGPEKHLPEAFPAEPGAGPRSQPGLPAKAHASREMTGRTRRSDARASRDTGRSSAEGKDFLEEARQSIPRRRKIASDILRDNGLDPDKEYTYSDYMIPLGVGGANIQNKKPLVDLYLEDEIVKVPLFSRSNSHIIDKLPQLDSLFENSYYRYIEKVSGTAFEKVMDRLADLGVGAGDKASILTVQATKRVLGPIGRRRVYNPVGHLGHILKIENGTESKYFAVVPRHRDMVIPVPEDKTGQAGWFRNNAPLFFDDDFKGSIPPVTYFTSVFEEGLSVREAAKESTAHIIKDSLLPLQGEAFDETAVEKAVQFHRELTVPYYGVARDIGEGNYGRAAVAGALETAGLAGTAAKLGGAARALGRAGKIAGKLKGASKQANRADEAAETLVKQAGRGRPRPSGAGLAAKARVRPDHARKAPVQFVRSFPPASDLSHSPAVRRELREIDRLIEGNGNLRPFFRNPKESCEAALGPVSALLKDAGYETRVRAMYLWSNAKIDAPKNHFLVLARKDGMEYAVDVTAGQFSEFGISRGIIESEEVWAKTFHDAAKRTLIKYKDFNTAQAARTEFHAAKAVEPAEALDEATILSRPAWYGKTGKLTPFYKHTDEKHGIVKERIGNRYLIRRLLKDRGRADSG